MAHTLTVPARPLWVALVIGHAWVGGAWLLASPALVSSGSLAELRAWAPMRVWGAVLLFGAVLTLLARWASQLWAILAHATAAAPLLIVAAATLVTLLDGRSQGAGASALFMIPALVHLALAQSRWREWPRVRLVE